MLSEDAIENLIQPILDRQQKINMYVIRKIAQTIKDVGELTPSQVQELQTLLQSGADARMINRELAKLTQIQEQAIKQMIQIVAIDAYKGVKQFYDYRLVPYVPFKQNVELQKTVQAIANQTANTYTNMAKAQAFMLRDPTNPKRFIPTPPAKTYQTVVDEAIQITQSGVVDYNTAMRRSLMQLTDSGLRTVQYQTETGRMHSQRLDTALRRNLLDGVRAINQGVQDVTGQQFGADGKEITVHTNPAPDHKDVQGHQFSNEEFEKMQDGQSFVDYQGKQYAGFERAIGTLNCRHFTFSIILGYAKPNYTQDELNKILARNEKGYTLPNGKHLTMYECTQRQRQLETRIRELKEKSVAFETAGMQDLANDYRQKVRIATNEYRIFSQSCGLSMKLPKIKVDNYQN